MKNQAQNILLIEDSNLQGETFQSILKENNYNVVLIKDGKQAFDYLLNDANNPDVVIVDFQLPSMNGMEIIASLKSAGKEFAFLFFSAANDMQTGINALNAGALDFIPKTQETINLLPLAVEKTYQIFKNNIERNLIKSHYAEQEKRFRLIAEKIEDVIWTLNIDTLRYTFVSPSVFRLRGVKYQEAILQSMTEFMTPETYSTLTNLFNEIKINRKITFKDTLELEFIHKDGSLIPVEISFSLLTDNKGKPTEILGVTRNITNRKKIEDARKTSLHLNHNMDKSSIEELMKMGLEEAVRLTESKIGFLHFVNTDEKTIDLQIWSENTMSNCVSEVSNKHYPIIDAGIWVDCVHQRKPVVCNDYNIVPNKKGLPEGHFPLSRMLTIPVFENDKIISILGVGNKQINYDNHDIELLNVLTENIWNIVRRKQTEILLKESEEKYRNLSENINDGIYYTLNGKFEYTNKALNNIFGFKEGELNDTYSWDLAKPELRETVKIQMYEKLIKQDFSLIEVACIKKNGEEVNIEIGISKIYENGYVYGVVRDITKRKQTEEQLLQYTKELKELNSTQNKLFSIIAHDLKNPFSNLMGFSQLLLKNIHKYDLDKIEKFVEIINDTSQQIYALLDNLLQWTKSQMNTLLPSPELVFITNLLNDPMYFNMAKQKGISLTNSVDEELHVFADLNMTKTIFRNLIQNAIKYTGIGGEINISAIENGKFVEIKFTDNGIGIPSDKISSLFSGDKSVSTQGTHGESGTGLGLALCKEFSEKNKGSIQVTSILGKGSSFIVSLPKTY